MKLSDQLNTPICGVSSQANDDDGQQINDQRPNGYNNSNKNKQKGEKKEGGLYFSFFTCEKYMRYDTILYFFAAAAAAACLLCDGGHKKPKDNFQVKQQQQQQQQSRKSVAEKNTKIPNKKR